MTISSQIAEWIYSFDFESIPALAVEKAKACIADVCAVSLAGSENIFARQLRQALIRDHRNDACRIIGTNLKADTGNAALINAFSAHILDFDDTAYDAGVIHPSAVMFPAVLALGEKLHANGRNILLSYVVGFEIAGRIGMAAKQLYKKGWFTTSLFGAIGAAAAAAKMLKLNPETTQNAIGLAMSQLGGMRQNNGTPAKAYAVGKATENGILAAKMALKGLRASTDIFEGPQGFFHIYCDDHYDCGVFGQVGEPLVIQSPGVSFKPYPTCSSAHAAMDAAHAIMTDNNLSWEQVEKIYCRTTETALRFLMHNEPKTVEQAMFSLPFCLACMIKERSLEPNHLAEELLHDDIICDLMRRVDSEAVQKFEHNTFTADKFPEGAEVTVWTKGGERFKKFIGTAKGSVSRPFNQNEHRAKFVSCTKNMLSPEKINCCLDIIAHLDSLDDIQVLSEILSPK